MAQSMVNDLPDLNDDDGGFGDDDNTPQLGVFDFSFATEAEEQGDVIDVQCGVETPASVIAGSLDVDRSWMTLRNHEGGTSRSITPRSFSISCMTPHFIHGSFKKNGEKYHLKVGTRQVLKLGLGFEKFTGTLTLFIRRTEFRTHPFTGEGSCVAYPEARGSDLKLWPFRASTEKNRGVSYTRSGPNYSIDVQLDQEDEIYLTFLKLSTFVTGDERENGGLRQKRAKEMTLVLQSKVDDQDQREIPIQIMAEDRYVKPSHRQLAKRAREQAIKTEPTVAGMDAEPFQPKVPRVEAAGTADILTQQDQNTMIYERLQESSPEITRAIYTLLFTNGENFQ